MNCFVVNFEQVSQIIVPGATVIILLHRDKKQTQKDIQNQNCRYF